jgi:hypothetical protein
MSPQVGNLREVSDSRFTALELEEIRFEPGQVMRSGFQQVPLRSTSENMTFVT